jgi:uncharacterized phiE125 gp8 family phage protein
MIAQKPIRTVAPAGQPVTLAEAKAQCRVDHSDEDTLISGLIAAAVAHVDGYTGVLGRALLTQTWRVDADEPGKVVIPLEPVQSVAVQYVDEAGATQSFTQFDLVRGDAFPFIQLKDTAVWPDTKTQPDAFRVTAVVGYGDASAVPQPIKQAILLMVGHLYANREAVGESMTAVPMAVDALLAPYRLVGL